MQKKLVAIFLMSMLLCGCSNQTDSRIDDLMQVDDIQSNYIISLQNSISVSGVSSDEKVILPKYEKLYEANTDMIGFIYLDNNHKYPILMNKDDQNFYLRKDFFGDDNKAGSIFANVNSSFNQQGISLIYGHNMRSGEMFGTLNEFSVNDIIQVDSLYEQCTYKVVAIMKTSMHEDFRYYDYVGNLSEKEFSTWREDCQGYLISGSLSDLTYEDTIIELSTCSYHTDDGRLVLILKKEV